MFKTNELQQRIAKINRYTEGSRTKEVLTYCADIKEMYTNLPHDKIMEAISWLITQPKINFSKIRER